MGWGEEDGGRSVLLPGARLAEAILAELELMAWTEQLPGDVPWTRQVWWRVELWTAFWRARDEELLRERRRLEWR